MLAPLLLALQTASIPAAFGTLQHPAAVSADGAEILGLCHVTARPAVAELLNRDARLSDSLQRRNDSPGTWEALACTRAMLSLNRASTSKGGMLMPDGGDWGQGAINVLLRGGQTRMLAPGALELLGALYLRDLNRSPTRDIAKAMIKAVDSGIRSRLVLRACSQAATLLGDAATVRRCSGSALAVGVDSSWHLLAWARERMLASDTASGSLYFDTAIAAARDSLSRSEISWHLQWFANSKEMAAWNASQPEERAKLLRSLMATRDVRDGRSRGARLAEHFTRLAYVEKHFSITPARLGEAQVRSGLPAGWNPNDQGFRDAQRWQSNIDDRGVVYMRYGMPQFRKSGTYTFCTAPSRRCTTAMDSALNLRRLSTEDWEYRFNLDTFPVHLRFQEEWFDGTVEATTLKGGRALLSMLVRNDDNISWADHSVRVDALFHHIWDPVSGEPIALVPFAVPIADLAKNKGDLRQITLDLALRQWDASAEIWHDSTVRRIMPLLKGAAGNMIAGTLALPSSLGTSAWSLFVSQGKDRLGQKYVTGAPRVATTRAVTLSDLVVGAASQGLRWQQGDESVTLAWKFEFDRKEELALFFQTKADSAIRDARVVVTIGPQIADGDTLTTLRVGVTQTIEAGIHSHTRLINLARLPSGNYSLGVDILGPRGDVLVRRQTAMVLK